MRRYWPILLLALVPLIPLWRTVFAGEAIGAFDQIRQMAPWNADAPQRPWDVLQADSVLQFYPWRDLVFDAWSKGEAPLWNPYQLAGTPLLANSQSAALYPLHIAAGLSGVPTAPAMTLLAWFHLFWAGLGVYVLCLRLGGPRLGAVFGGVSFQLSAFMVSWTALPSVITTSAWIPWCIWATYGAFGFGGPSEGASRADKHRFAFRNVALLALCTGMLLLAGHLQFAAYGLMAVVLIAIWLLLYPVERFPFGRRAFPALACVVALALGACLAAPQLLPVLRYGEYSHRQNTPTEEGYKGYVSLAIGIETISILFPDMVGSPDRRSSKLVPPYPPAPEDDLSQYWPALNRQGANFAETAIGISPLILAMALLGMRLRPRRQDGMVLVGLIALLLAVGTPLNRLLYFYFPGWSSTGSPARISVLFVLAACVMAGTVVFAEALADKKRVRNALLAAMGLGGLFLAVGGFLLPGMVKNRFDPSFDMSEYVRAAIQPHLSLGLASLLATGLVFYAFSRSTRAGAWALLGVAIVLPSLQYAATLVPSGVPLAKIEGPKSERIAVVNEPWELIAAAPANLPPNTATLSRIHDIGGYDSLLHKDTKAVLDGINGADSAPPANGNMMFVKPSLESRKLAEAGVSQVWTPQPLPSLGQPNSMEGGLGRYTVSGPGRIELVPSGRILGEPAAPVIQAEGFGWIRIKATGPGRLILRDRNMPGWTAEVGGKTAKLEGTTWLEVELPLGEHTVVFDYDPPGMRTGFILFAVGLAPLIFLLVGRVGRVRPVEPIQAET